ncbi:MAG: hypothetical protein WDA20_02015 [Desulfuromonadales bacterium]
MQIGKWRKRMLLTGMALMLVSFAGKAEAQQPETVAGDPMRGEALYVGTASFEKGGAPCLACHGISGAGLGLAAGASYGPDLTAMWENYGEEGVAMILEELPFPSMEPIYAERPLTVQERQDVTAFLASAEGQTPPKVTGRFALQGGGATLALLGVMYVFGAGRLQGVRRPLVEMFGKPRKGEMR